MIYIFIDTNIFLHYRDFREIDWLKLVSAEKCTLVVPSIVIDELDEKKIGTNKISTRARQNLNLIEELTENPNIKENVYFKPFLDKPLQHIYKENELNFKEQDHRLFASIMDFKQKNGVNNIILCTNDVGPRLRAKRFGIKTLKLPDELLLPNQESEEKKKIKKLEEENRKLKSKIPDLFLSFDNGKDFLKYNISEFEEVDFESFKNKKLNEIKQKYPYIKKVDSYKNPLVASLSQATSLTTEQINSYNKKLDEYYNEFEKALEKIYESEKRKQLTFEINLLLFNNGSVPAEDIDIHLHFPDGFELRETEEEKKRNKIELPEPPYRPKHKFDYGFLRMPTVSGIHSIDSIVKDMNINGPNIGGPNIKKTNSYTVDYSREMLKHGYQENLESLSIIFEKSSDIKNFNLEYIIRVCP